VDADCAKRVTGKSMRSTIIICAATLDAQLEKLIKNILLQEKNTDGDIFEGGNAILSTFSSKITFAYYLGLISEHERKTLDCIRKIRNKAAHEISILSGSVSDSINNMCLNLELPQGMYIPIELFTGKFKTWINSNSEHFDIYCRSQGYKIDLSKEDKKIISNIVERVYGYRCSIAHAKGDVEEYIAIPNISRKIIAAEIPLVKYLAYEVIKNCSEI